MMLTRQTPAQLAQQTCGWQPKVASALSHVQVRPETAILTFHGAMQGIATAPCRRSSCRLQQQQQALGHAPTSSSAHSSSSGSRTAGRGVAVHAAADLREGLYTPDSSEHGPSGSRHVSATSCCHPAAAVSCPALKGTPIQVWHINQLYLVTHGCKLHVQHAALHLSDMRSPLPSTTHPVFTANLPHAPPSPSYTPGLLSTRVV
jgi:2-methylcitrate dehydratase PrpD